MGEAPCESAQKLVENARCPHTLAPEDRTKVNALRLPWPFHESSVGSLYFTLGVALLLVLAKHVQVHVAAGTLALAPAEVAMIAAVAVLACYYAFRFAVLCYQRARATPLVLVGAAGRVLRFQVLRDAARRVQFVELDAVRCARGAHVAELVRTHVSACGLRIYAANGVDQPRAQALADADAAAAAAAQLQRRLLLRPEGSDAAGAADAAAAAQPLPSWAAAMLDPKGAAHIAAATLVGYVLSSDALVETSVAQCRAPPVAGLLSTPRHLFVRTATSLVMYNRSRQGDIEGRVSTTLVAADENARSVAIEPGRRRVLLVLLEEDCGARVCAYAIHHDKAKLLLTANIALDHLSGPVPSAPPLSSPPIALAYTADGQHLLLLRRDALSVYAVDAEGLPDRSALLASASIASGGASTTTKTTAAVAMTQWKVSNASTIVAIATRDGAVTLFRLRARTIDHLTTCTPPKVQSQSPAATSCAIAIASLREKSRRLIIILLPAAFYAYDCDETGSAARFLSKHSSASMLSATSLCTTDGRPT
jgi:hypothetical protein